jgi:serine/threonine protein kinase
MTDYVATRWYRSPELILTPKYSLPVDIWAVGCIMGEMIDGQPMFPGDDTLDQLYQIINIIGPFDEALIKKFYENPMLKNLRFPASNNIQNLDRRYRKKIDKAGLDLLSKLLRLDENTRPTAEQALLHPFFADLLKEDQELVDELQKVSLNHISSLSSLHNVTKGLHKFEKDEIKNDKENMIPKNQITPTNNQIKKSLEQKGHELEQKLGNLNQPEKGYFQKIGNFKGDSNKRAKDPKLNDSFNEDNNRPKDKRYQAKNKSENIDYKMKNRTKKFCTANSINFVIKKMNNFGVSLYNPKEGNPKKQTLAFHREKNAGLAKSSFFRIYDIPQTAPSSNKLFPSIQNIKFGESKQNWNYKA